MTLSPQTSVQLPITISELLLAAQQKGSPFTRFLFGWLSLDFKDQPLIYHPNNHYYYSQICWGSAVELVLIIWPPGSGSGCHDHQSSFNLLHCLLGQLNIYNFVCCQNQLHLAQHQILSIGTTAKTFPYQIHEVVNPSPVDWAASLHIYFPVRQWD
jgi:hypothetical protein